MEWGNWSKLPDKFLGLITNTNSTPEDWFQDYLELMMKLQDPAWGNQICWSCVVHQADYVKGQIDRFAKYWEENGGEAGKEERFVEMGEEYRLSYEKDDALRDVHWRVFNELGEANNRTCKVVNYFKCSYGEKRQELVDNGLLADKIWQHIEWYDRH